MQRIEKAIETTKNPTLAFAAKAISKSPKPLKT